MSKLTHLLSIVAATLVTILLLPLWPLIVIICKDPDKDQRS